MPVNYALAKIYCIRSPHTDLIYIGATVQSLSRRMTNHRQDQKNNIAITSKIILEFGDAYIELLENFPCTNKEELAKKEGEYIRREENCCNKIIPARTLKEYREDNREAIAEYRKKYNETNKESIAEQKKQYNETNKESILEQNKKYYEENRDAINEKHKQYREANKVAINEKRRKAYAAKKAT